MNTKIVRRSLQTLGAFYGLYATVVLLGFAGSTWSVMRIGTDGIWRCADIINTSWSFFVMGFFLMPLIVFVCLSIAYSFLRLRKWGRHLALGFNALMALLVLRRMIWPIDLTSSQLDSLRSLLSERLGMLPDSLTISDLLASITDEMGAIEFIVKTLVLGGISMFCMHPQVRQIMEGRERIEKTDAY